MKKNAIFAAVIAALLVGCNSSDNSYTDRETVPGDPGSAYPSTR